MPQPCPPIAEHDINSLFATRGLRVTRQRQAVYQALACTTRHPTADEIYQDVSRNDHDISLATVYNTLEALCKVGLAQKLSDGNGSARYDADVHNHVHLRDDISGKVTDVADQLSNQFFSRLPDDVLRKIEEQLGFRIDRINVELVGRYE